MTEKVNHPAHYGGDTVYEVIKVINAWGLNYNLGNTVKYIARAGKKDTDAVLLDLQKAAWYLNWEIGRIERELANNREVREHPLQGSFADRSPVIGYSQPCFSK